MLRAGQPERITARTKVAAILALCRRHGYHHLISIDDDVLLSPAALAATVRALPLALASPAAGGRGCAMVAPTLSTGIPTVEPWAEAFLSPPERAALYGCFEVSVASPPKNFGGLDVGAAVLAAGAGLGVAAAYPEGPWNGTEWCVSSRAPACCCVALSHPPVHSFTRPLVHSSTRPLVPVHALNRHAL